jgi:ketosteroid isomerase-like protein
VSENVEYIRRWVDALNRRDLEALVEGAGPDFEWVVAREHPDAATHVGIEATLEYLGEWLRMMPDFHVQIEEITEHGDRILTVIHLTGSGAGSGAGTEVRTAMISTFREGRPVRTEEYLDPDEARELVAS